MDEESLNSQTKSVRLTPDEISFLEKHDLSLSDLTHESIEKHKKKHEQKTRKQKINKAIIDGIFLMIGILFIWTVNFSNNIYGILIVAGMGIGFCLVGGVGLYRGMKQEGMFNGRK